MVSMKRKILILALMLCLVLAGCGWMDRSYSSVIPHQQPSQSQSVGGLRASDYPQLCRVLEQMISSGTETAVINVSDYDPAGVARGMELAARYARISYPIGAYAVESISYEVGSSGGAPAIAVKIAYGRSKMELSRIRKAADMDGAAVLIGSALDRCEAGIVILVDSYASMDLAQLVQDYGLSNPDTIMEIPQVTEDIYPSSGKQRVLDLKFTYQTSREDLRQMQSQVKPVFEAAALYVSGDGAQRQKYTQLYAFLMERFAEYQIKTSITPSYSLLRHGVGDSRTFAMVYGEMCRRAGLSCRIVVGTKAGEPWFWNMIEDGGYYYHVDLLRCQSEGGFRMLTDAQMESCVWDYSAYPQCQGAPPTPVIPETQPATQPPEETAGSGETVPENKN